MAEEVRASRRADQGCAQDSLVAAYITKRVNVVCRENVDDMAGQVSELWALLQEHKAPYGTVPIYDA